MPDPSWLSLLLAGGGALIGAIVGAFGAGWRVRNELRALERDLLERLDERAVQIEARVREERALSDRLYARAEAHATIVAEQRETRHSLDRVVHALERLERKLDRHEADTREDVARRRDRSRRDSDSDSSPGRE